MFYHLKLECLVLTTFICLALMNRSNQILNGYKKEKDECSNKNLYFFEVISIENLLSLKH